MKKISLALITLLLITCVGCTSKTDANSTPEPTPAVATPTPEPEPELDIELPPVEVTYNMEYDTNKDGSIDKAEWEAYVSAHPEDTNKDMVISAEEKGEVATPVETPKPAENTQKPVETPKPSNNNTTKPVETPKPTTPPAPVVTPPPADDGIPTAPSQEEIDRQIEEQARWAEENGLRPIGDLNDLIESGDIETTDEGIIIIPGM